MFTCLFGEKADKGSSVKGNVLNPILHHVRDLHMRLRRASDNSCGEIHQISGRSEIHNKLALAEETSIHQEELLRKKNESFILINAKLSQPLFLAQDMVIERGVPSPGPGQSSLPHTISDNTLPGGKYSLT